MIYVLLVVGYVLNLLLNRWLFLMVQKHQGYDYVNPAGVVACFLSLAGTLILSFILFTYIIPEINVNWFKYKRRDEEK